MVGRNDPCPCGSGKKYKQCCLTKQSEVQTGQVKERHFFDRKYKLTMDIYSFLAQKHGGEWAFDHQICRPFDSSLGIAREGFGNMWAFFFRVYDNGMRGIDWFLEERGKRYSGEDREMLERWRIMKVSCFQLVDQYEQGEIIEDIWSGERFRMPYCETMMELPPWSTAVGMIEPYAEGWCIHGAMTWDHPDIKSVVMTRVQELQEEKARTSGRKLSPTEVLIENYPDIINLSHSDNLRKSKLVKDHKSTKELIYVTYRYNCEDPELLVDMLLDREDEYILMPGTDPAESKLVIGRVERLDGLFNTIPVDCRKRLMLDEIDISYVLGKIVIDNQEVTVSGWWSGEMESTLKLLKSDMASAVGLSQVDEQREAHQVPQGTVFKKSNIITEKNLSEQEITAYANLPQLLQWFRDEREKRPEESAETLVRSKEHEQYRMNPKVANLNLLRIALGMPESPFTRR